MQQQRQLTTGPLDDVETVFVQYEPDEVIEVEEIHEQNPPKSLANKPCFEVVDLEPDSEDDEEITIKNEALELEVNDALIHSENEDSGSRISYGSDPGSSHDQASISKYVRVKFQKAKIPDEE